MMTRESDTGRSPETRPRRHRLLPIAGGGVAVAVVLAHLGSGALVMHVGLPAALVYLGLDGPLQNLNSGVLLIGIVTIAVMMLRVVFGVRRWLQRR
jgi:hypothetical protein